MSAFASEPRCTSPSQTLPEVALYADGQGSAPLSEQELVHGAEDWAHIAAFYRLLEERRRRNKYLLQRSVLAGLHRWARHLVAPQERSRKRTQKRRDEPGHPGRLLERILRGKLLCSLGLWRPDSTRDRQLTGADRTCWPNLTEDAFIERLKLAFRSESEELVLHLGPVFVDPSANKFSALTTNGIAARMPRSALMRVTVGMGMIALNQETMLDFETSVPPADLKSHKGITTEMARMRTIVQRSFRVPVEPRAPLHPEHWPAAISIPECSFVTLCFDLRSELLGLLGAITPTEYPILEIRAELPLLIPERDAYSTNGLPDGLAATSSDVPCGQVWRKALKLCDPATGHWMPNQIYLLELQADASGAVWVPGHAPQLALGIEWRPHREQHPGYGAAWSTGTNQRLKIPKRAEMLQAPAVRELPMRPWESDKVQAKYNGWQSNSADTNGLVEPAKAAPLLRYRIWRSPPAHCTGVSMRNGYKGARSHQALITVDRSTLTCIWCGIRVRHLLALMLHLEASHDLAIYWPSFEDLVPPLSAENDEASESRHPGINLTLFTGGSESSDTQYPASIIHVAPAPAPDRQTQHAMRCLADAVQTMARRCPRRAPTHVWMRAMRVHCASDALRVEDSSAAVAVRHPGVDRAHRKVRGGRVCKRTDAADALAWTPPERAPAVGLRARESGACTHRDPHRHAAARTSDDAHASARPALQSDLREGAQQLPGDGGRRCYLRALSTLWDREYSSDVRRQCWLFLSEQLTRASGNLLRRDQPVRAARGQRSTSGRLTASEEHVASSGGFDAGGTNLDKHQTDVPAGPATRKRRAARAAPETKANRETLRTTRILASTDRYAGSVSVQRQQRPLLDTYGTKRERPMRGSSRASRASGRSAHDFAGATTTAAGTGAKLISRSRISVVAASPGQGAVYANVPDVQPCDRSTRGRRQGNATDRRQKRTRSAPALRQARTLHSGRLRQRYAWRTSTSETVPMTAAANGATAPASRETPRERPGKAAASSDSRLFDRTYYHSFTFAPMSPDEVLAAYDSELEEVDDAWLVQLSDHRIDQFLDVLPVEKVLMKAWNAFLKEVYPILGDRSVRDAVRRFAPWFVARLRVNASSSACHPYEALRTAFLMHLRALWQFHLLGSEQVAEAMIAFDRAWLNGQGPVFAAAADLQPRLGEGSTNHTHAGLSPNSLPRSDHASGIDGDAELDPENPLCACASVQAC